MYIYVYIPIQLCIYSKQIQRRVSEPEQDGSCFFFCRSRKSFKCLDADAPENQQTDIPQVWKHKNFSTSLSTSVYKSIFPVKSSLSCYLSINPLSMCMINRNPSIHHLILKKLINLFICIYVDTFKDSNPWRKSHITTGTQFMKELCQQVLRGAKSAPQAYHHDKQTDKIICLIRKNLGFFSMQSITGRFQRWRPG